MASRRYAFIRAINTGKRRLTNEMVTEPFAALGLDDVQAYQAAGNVGFLSDEEPEALTSRLQAALAEAYGFDAPTFVRTDSDLRGLVEAQPFTADQLADTEGRVQVAFLRGEPDADQVQAVEELAPAADLVAFHGAHWLWLPLAGISTSEMPVGKVEETLGAMTIRTMGTIERMLKKFTP